MKQVSLKKNFILSTLYQVLTMLTPLITAPYVSRVIGADGIGVYSYTGSIQYYFAMFAALGTVTYGGREIARVRDNEQKRSVIFWEIELLSVATTLVSMAVWILVIIFYPAYRLVFIILSFNILAVMFDISWFYAGIEHFEHTVLQNSIFKILGIVSIFIFVKNQNDLLAYIFIMSAVVLLSNLSMWLYLPRYIVTVKWRDLKIVNHFRETLIYFVPTIATSIYTVMDKTLIGLITGNNSQNGYYEQATKIINMAKTVCFVALNAVMGSRISFLFAKEKHEEVKELINTSINYILFMGVGIMFGLLGIFSNFVPWFFGDGYDAVITLMWILCPMSLIIGVSNCLGSHYYTPIGLRALSAKYLIAGSGVNLVLNCILIPVFGSYGAAFASVIAELVITALYMSHCDGYLTYKRLGKYIWKKILAGVIMYGWLLLLTNLIVPNIKVIAIGIPSAIIIYSTLLFLLRDDFMLQVVNIAKNKVKR